MAEFKCNEFAGRRVRHASRAVCEGIHSFAKCETRAEAARTIGLSPSWISAMFKGQTFPSKKASPKGDLALLDCRLAKCPMAAQTLAQPVCLLDTQA
jgi:hypothetical protein